MTLRSTAAKMRKSLRAVNLRLSSSSPQRKISPTQKLILRSMLNGATLKSQRYLDGRKEFRLHLLNGNASQVTMQDVRGLENQGLLLSNHKFPAATLFLSQRGRRAAANE